MFKNHNSELEKFAHMCTHDLNEPLRTISVYTQLLKVDFGDKLLPGGRQYLDLIMKNLKHLESLMESILAYSTLDSTGLNKDTFDLHSLIDSLLTVFEKIIREKNAYVYSCDLPKVYGNAILISRVFQNLINNALKFNKSERSVVRISHVENINSILFCIEDNGIGIEPAYYQKIFEPFKRLHCSSEYEGTGLGLSISRKIIESHGGKIWVKSTPNEGSQFFFTLPKKQAYNRKALTMHAMSAHDASTPRL